MQIVPDNASPADLGDEPEGFWNTIHDQVDAWITQYAERADDEPTV